MRSRFFDPPRGRLVHAGKIRPGRGIGLFATRTPHRPNPIGLSVAQLIEVRKDGALVLGGADVVDGTPVLRPKPHLQHRNQPPV